MFSQFPFVVHLLTSLRLIKYLMFIDCSFLSVSRVCLVEIKLRNSHGQYILHPSVDKNAKIGIPILSAR